VVVDEVGQVGLLGEPAQRLERRSPDDVAAGQVDALAEPLGLGQHEVDHGVAVRRGAQHRVQAAVGAEQLRHPGQGVADHLVAGVDHGQELLVAALGQPVAGGTAMGGLAAPAHVDGDAGQLRGDR
jgi:hypothetical protein